MTRQTRAPLQVGFGLDELRAAVGNSMFTTVPVVAKLMDLDERTVRRGIERGEIPAVRVASATRIPVTALLRLAGLEPESTSAIDPSPATHAVAFGGDAARPSKREEAPRAGD
jgi:excisionase family DNA binding protein